jgi:hypothetical protein
MRKDGERLILTRHFSQRWQERVGNWPTPEAIADYIRHSVRVQGCEDFTRKDGSSFRMLAIYWHPALDLVIKVDGIRNAAVTVLSMDNWRYGHPNMGVAALPGQDRNQLEDGPPARHRSCSGEAGGAVPAATGQVPSAMAERIKGIKAIFGGKTMSGGVYGV